tara:strand:+ start:84 stop:2327 length:2244 start_codon:yes stop_codon:yes gene_type:complete
LRALFVLETEGLHMDAQPRGSLDPWCKDGSDCKPEWDSEKIGHEHPLEFMAELLQQWPTGAPTVDLGVEERHLRFIQIVAGYPEIGRGMYPLDWPTHPMSVKALQLSLFLDSLPVPENLNQIDSPRVHSVRSAILSIDSQEYEKDTDLSKKGLRKMQLICLKILFESLRKWQSLELNEQWECNREESAFLTSLHSSDNRGHAYWPKKGFNPVVILQRINRDSFDSENVHTFKFNKIQTWLTEWTRNNVDAISFLEPNVRHNLHIGSSVMLESMFAMVRSHIINRYRPGCIIIDGGGQISFYTQKKNVKKELFNLIERSFIGGEENKNIHPYNHTILNTLIRFGEGKICRKKECKSLVPSIKQKKEFVNCKCGSQFPYWEWKEDNTPRRLAFERFLMKDNAAKKFYPQMKYKNEYELIQNVNQLECPLCNLETGKNAQWNDSIFEVEGICFLHTLTFKIGVSHKRRDFSIRITGKAIQSTQSIHSCAMVDLNALGVFFNLDLAQSVKEEMLSIATHKNRSVEDVEEIRNWVVNVTDVFDSYESNNQRDSFPSREYELIYNNIKDQIQIFKERKSFRFNSIWWNCVSQIIEQKSKPMGQLGAWVAAGDDLLFVRRGEMGEENDSIHTQLIELDRLLKLKFNKSEIAFSFKAGIATRIPGQKITEMTGLALENEEIAKDNWKTRAKKSGRLELIQQRNKDSGNLEDKPFTPRYEWEEKDGPVYSIPSVRNGVPTEEESMIYHSTSEREEK